MKMNQVLNKSSIKTSEEIHLDSYLRKIIFFINCFIGESIVNANNVIRHKSSKILERFIIYIENHFKLKIRSGLLGNPRVGLVASRVYFDDLIIQISLKVDWIGPQCKISV